MKKIKLALSIALLTTIIATSCKNKPTTNCLPAFIHTGYSDSLNAIDNVISLQEAKDMINRFRSDSTHNGNIFPSFQSFKRDAFYSLINRDSIVGVRLYYGKTVNNVVKVIAMGIRPNGVSDIILLIDKVRVPDTIDDALDLEPNFDILTSDTTQ